MVYLIAGLKEIYDLKMKKIYIVGLFIIENTKSRKKEECQSWLKVLKVLPLGIENSERGM